METELPGCPGNLQAVRIALFQQRDDHFFRRAGVRGAFERDQLTFTDIRRNGLHCPGHEAQIGLVVFVQGGRNIQAAFDKRNGSCQGR